MIQIFFRFGNEYILVQVKGNSILFGNTTFGNKLASIDGLKLSRDGVEKEFPDLADSPIWREEAIRRFKDLVKKMKGEKAKAKYIIEELRKHNYEPLSMRQDGYREEKFE